MPEAEPLFADAVLRRICDVLGETHLGLSNKEIDEMLAAARITDPTPRDVGPGMYVAMNKRDRLYHALHAAQRQSGAGNVVIRFITAAMHPARYAGSPDMFEERRQALNVVLSFASLKLREDNRMTRARTATTLTEARRRAEKLRGILSDRGAHPRLLVACVADPRRQLLPRGPRGLQEPH